MFALNFNKTEDEKILVCNMPKSCNVLIYSVNKNLYSEISKHFPLMSVFPQSYSFIENHYQKNKIAEDSDIGKMFVQVFDDFIEIIVLKESELKFYNTFSYKTNNDILYFIINVFEQLKLSQTETSIGFSGLIETDNLTILNLRKFVQIVYFESQNPYYKYFYKFQETAPHYFYNFLNIC
ncbi:MAG: hypothetical protein C0596_18325 [Marinilabiliales bacterium]|nr:MAG: hypothetical protein C0596_18325 [Marinilabiliales bacterium]